MMKKQPDFCAAPAEPELQMFFAACLGGGAAPSDAGLAGLTPELLEVLQGMADHIQRLEARVKMLEGKR